MIKYKKKNKLVNQEEQENFLKNALALTGSITPKVIKNVLLAMAYAGVISVVHYFLPAVSLPTAMLEYAGLSLGLILVFRVNAGYDRWWEARKLWGNIINHSRNFTIVLMNYPNTSNKLLITKITNYITALPFLIKNNLREDHNLSQIKHLVDSELFLKLSESKHKVNIMSSILADEIKLLRQNDALDSFAFLKAEEKRELILDCHGACERILRTPMPYVMAIKSRRFIFLFLVFLPFTLINVSPMLNPLMTGLVAYAILSLDQIGIELQNPFSEKNLSHLPLNDICDSIEKNISEIREYTFNSTN